MCVLAGLILSISWLPEFPDCCQQLFLMAIMTYQSRVQRHRKQRP